MTDDIHDQLTEARTALETTRKALQPLPDGDGTLAPLVARLGRMAEEVTRIGDVLAGIGDVLAGQAVEV